MVEGRFCQSKREKSEALLLLALASACCLRSTCLFFANISPCSLIARLNQTKQGKIRKAQRKVVIIYIGGWW